MSNAIPSNSERESSNIVVRTGVTTKSIATQNLRAAFIWKHCLGNVFILKIEIRAS